MRSWQPSAGPLRGIIVPMVTPLSGAEELDAAGVERLVDRLLGGGVHGLFVLGTCGEGPSLGGRVRRQVIDRVCQQVNGHVPVLVGVTDSSPDESAALARYAAEAGAAAAVMAPPFYYPLDQAELIACVDRLLGASPLPVMLYNMPPLTKVAFELDTVRRLMDRPRVIGLKDSSGNVEYFRHVREASRTRPDWTLLMGPEHLLPEAVELGGDGGVTGGANVWPELFVQIYEAARAGFVDELASLQSDAARLGHIFGEFSAASVVKGLKTALHILGICSNLPSPPLDPLPASQTEQIQRIVHLLGLAPATGHSLAAQHQ